MSFYYDPSTPGTPFSQMTSPSGMRLTPDSSSAVVDVSFGALYLQPYLSDCIWVPTSAGGWKMWRTAAINAVAPVGAGLYDVFAWDNAGTLTLALSTVWTNDTTRANALTTLDGVLVNGSTEGSMAASRGIFLGTVRSGSNFWDLPNTRWVCNYYNAIRRPLFYKDITDTNTATTFTTASTTWAATAGPSGFAYQLDFIRGKGPPPQITAYSVCNNTGASGAGIGINIDGAGTSAVAKGQMVNTSRAPVKCTWEDSSLAEGKYIVQIACVVVGGTGTFYADDIRSGGASDPAMTFLHGYMYG